MTVVSVRRHKRRTGHATRLSRSTPAALWALVAGLIVMYLLVFAADAAGKVAHPLDEFTYGESWLLDGARQVAQGAGLYAPADQIPLMHTAYTPVYYALVGGLQRILGDSGYIVGRLVSLAATLGGATALAWSVQRLTQRWSVGLLAAGLMLTQNLTILLWAPLHRVDPLALGLTLFGLALVSAGRVQVSAVVFVLATMTKQTFIVAPVAAAITLWPCRASFARFVAIVGGGLVVAVAAAQWLTHGWFLWHTVVANNNGADLITFSALMGSFLQFNGLPVLASLASLGLPASRAEWLWRLYFIGSLLTLPTIAKLGASSNYWLETTAASAALLALASYKLLARPQARLIAPTLLAGALLVAIPAYQAAAVEATNNLAEVVPPSRPRYLSLVTDTGVAPYRVDAAFVARIAREPGELLTDNSGLAVAAGKRIAYEFQIFQLLHVERVWSEQPIVAAIKARRFSLVALMHPLEGAVPGARWTPAVHRALVAAYAPAGAEAGFWLYRPGAN